MPTIIKNGRNYSGTSVGLTQAEYDALPEVTKMNGTTYFITDSDVVLDADNVALGNGTVEDLAGSVAVIETETASANRSVGDHILLNGQLYTITSPVATGETYAVGTNITATNVGAELTALNNGLTQFITYRNVQTTVTIPAGGSIFDQTLDVPTISGYKAFAIGGWHTQGGDYAISPFTRLNLNESSQQINYAMMTTSSSNVTLTIRIKVLYIRSNWVNIPV